MFYMAAGSRAHSVTPVLQLRGHTRQPKSTPPDKLITAWENPARVISERMNSVNIFRTSSGSMERLISMQNPFQLTLHQFGALVPQHRQARSRSVQLVQV